MRLSGHQLRSITYMMGNNIIAETMFRHDPGTILYAPLAELLRLMALPVPPELATT